MGILQEMADITAEHAGEKLRYFARADPEADEHVVLHLREDITWSDRHEAEVEAELRELVAKETYEHTMDATNVNQIIKVADDKIIFTGFIEDQVAIAAFDRGILGALPPIVADFREYMLEHDVDFISLGGIEQANTTDD